MEIALPSRYKNHSMATMKDIYEIRRDNFRELLRTLAPDSTEEGLKKATGPMADRLNRSQSLVSQWKSDTTLRKISHIDARKIEQEFGLEYGYMDNIRHDSIPRIFRQLLIEFEKAYVSENIKITPEKKADTIILCLSFFTPNNPPDKETLRRIMRTLL